MKKPSKWPVDENDWPIPPHLCARNAGRAYLMAIAAAKRRRTLRTKRASAKPFRFEELSLKGVRCPASTAPQLSKLW